MERYFRAGVLALALIIIAPCLWAQTESDERALIDVKDGLGFRQDSLFMLNLRFRMQNRMGATTVSGDDLSIKTVDARVRRLRLRLDGYMMTTRLRYYIQLNFSRADLDLETEGATAQPVRDAMVYYHFNKRVYIGFGQSKLPGNRQRVNSSGNLQFPDRSIANAAYTLDRDFGMFAYWTVPMGPQEVQIKTSISSGEGRGASPGGPGMAYTGRLEWLPMGAFSNKGDYSEGDLEMEPEPKVSLAAGYSFNDRSIRTGGQLGAELYDYRDAGTFIADALFKHRGWAFSTEYFDRRCDDPLTKDENGAVAVVTVGTGFNAELSRYFRSKYQIAGRYTFVQPDAAIQAYRRRTDETLLGLTRYFNGHRIKLQAYSGYRWLDRNIDLSHSGNAWTFMFQVEFGI
ncbi:MAG: porin [Flavobacteriales bacterium]|nr:porin [Flavobacteriales bacterium]